MPIGSMSAPTVRNARPEDEPELAEVDRLATAALRNVYRPTDAALKRRAVVVPDGRLVAILEERVVGTVEYYIREGKLFFLRLGVHPQFQRRGVARALIRQLETNGREHGCAAVILHTVRETGNVEVFQRLGFRVDSEGPTDLFRGEASSPLFEVVMRKDLIHE